jgi:hypothetical protein
MVGLGKHQQQMLDTLDHEGMSDQLGHLGQLDTLDLRALKLDLLDRRDHLLERLLWR